MDKTIKVRKTCHVCGQPIIGGTAGKDFHYVKTLYGGERYYCDKCMQKLMKGEI